jgi:exopolysaccharide biosynthesis predicted pyruvyltransferase EpsI
VVVVVIVAIAAGVTAFLIKRRKNNKKAGGDVELSASVKKTDELESIPVVKNVKIKERLGGGNFGDVYRGEWKGAQVTSILVFSHFSRLL